MEFPCARARTRAFIFLDRTLLDHGVLLLLVGLENRVNQPVCVCVYVRAHVCVSVFSYPHIYICTYVT